jgi:hypothetical protein
MTTKEEVAATYDRPKSVCSCSHTGDGPKSEHADGIQRGHGACTVAGCLCQQFSWAHWTLPFSAALARAGK